MTDNRKEMVKESAEVFKLDGLCGEDWNAGREVKEMEMED